MDIVRKTYQVLVGRSIRAVLIYRISHWLYKVKLKPFAQIFWSLNVMLHSIEISPLAKIGKNFKIAHTVGVVIGAGTIIGEDVVIYQNVTLGAKVNKNNKELYPMIGDGVKMFPGSVIIGGIEIGNNAVIAPNAVVIKDVPENFKAMGVPAKNYMN